VDFDEAGATRDGSIPEQDLRELARSLSAVLGELHLLSGERMTESLHGRLQEHLGVDPRGQPVVAQELPP
jgi:hypothetical protein